MLSSHSSGCSSALCSVQFWLEKAKRKAAKGQRAGDTSLWRRTESVRAFHSGEGLGETLSQYSSVAIMRTEALSSQGATWKNKWQWVQIVPRQWFFLYKRYFLFTERRVDPWNNFPRDVAESLTLEVFKMWLNKLLDHPIYHPFPTKSWSWWYSETPSDLGCFMILLPQLHLQPSSTTCSPAVWLNAGIQHVAWPHSDSTDQVKQCCFFPLMLSCLSCSGVGRLVWGFSKEREGERRAGSALGSVVLMWVQPPPHWPPPPSVQICPSAQVWQIHPMKGTSGRLGLKKQHEKCA